METQNNNNQPIILKQNSNSEWAKWLLGIIAVAAAAGGAWYLYKEYQTPELPPPTDVEPSLDENFEVTLWKNFFLSTGNDNWPTQILDRANKNGVSFRQQLVSEADTKFAHDGLTKGTYRDATMKAISARVLAIKRVPKWVQAVKDQAVERGVPYDQMLQINALWGIVETKINDFISRYNTANPDNPYTPGGYKPPVSGLKGTAVI